MLKDYIELKPIKESEKDYDALELKLKKFFREKIYIPMLRDLGISSEVIKNANHPNPLMDALFRGVVTYSKGRFVGKFNAEIAKEIRMLGATFDRKTSTYELAQKHLPPQISQMISAGESKFQDKMKKLDAKLAKVVPEELAAEFKCEDFFDKTLFKADKSFQRNVKNITVAPTLTDSQRADIAKQWQGNMQLWIKDWTQEQITDLRAKIYDDVIGGARRESFVAPILKVTKTIQDGHEEALKKAKFLAHQETRLLMAAFKQTKYVSAGVEDYIWRCVHRPHDKDPKQHTPGNVRYSHGILEGKIFKWTDPPVTTPPGEPARKNNPGQDYNCRCFARPILRRKT